MNQIVPKLPFSPDKETMDFLHSICAKGFFVKRSFSVWKGRVAYHGDLFSYTPNDKLSFELEIKMLKMKVNRFFFFNSCLVRDGVFFIPEDSVSMFISNVSQLQQEVTCCRDKILTNYDEVIKEVKDLYRKALYYKWVNELKNSGRPPESFIEKETRVYIENYQSKEVISDWFRLSVIPINMLFDDRFSPFGDISELNRTASMMLYYGIIKKRELLLFFLENRKKNIDSNIGPGKIKSLANFISLYRSTIFYGDHVLIDKISSLRDMIVKSPVRDKKRISERISDMIQHLVNDKRYFLQYGIKEKKIL